MSSRKILVLLSDNEDAQGCVNFVVQLFRETKTLVVVAFVNSKTKSEHHQKTIAAEMQQSFGAHPNVKILVRTGRNLTTAEMAREAKYTDLIVVQSAVMTNSLMNWWDLLPKDASQSTIQVPVIVVPDPAHKIDEILITYDGQHPNFGSIRQFCQIMGDFCSTVNVTLLEINHDCNHFLPEEEKLLIEYLKEHCKNIGVYKVADESPEKILQLVNCGQNAIVVSGTVGSLQASLPHLTNLTGKFIEENKMPGFFGASAY